MIGKLIKQADYALLATVLYVLALGLYSLFVDDRVPMPTGFASTTSGQLKELLAGVVVVAIAVIFLGQALTWDGTTDLLAPGARVGRRHRRAGAVPVAGGAGAAHGERGEHEGDGKAESFDPRERRLNGGLTDDGD